MKSKIQVASNTAPGSNRKKIKGRPAIGRFNVEDYHYVPVLGKIGIVKKKSIVGRSFDRAKQSAQNLNVLSSLSRYTYRFSLTRTTKTGTLYLLFGTAQNESETIGTFFLRHLLSDLWLEEKKGKQ